MEALSSKCPICVEISARLPERDRRPAAMALLDANPLTPGHLLIVPTRHIERVEQLAPGEWRSVFELVKDRATKLSAEPGIDGVNIGVNSGEAAGQTVAHAHVHVIPRRKGDCADPSEGVRRSLAIGLKARGSAAPGGVDGS
jgi:diadenosine tetraphosphate (Ap4A) HIT family hydrolase